MRINMKNKIVKAKGKIESFEVNIPSLKETHRMVKVYLPPDYDNSHQTYPVLYMHDGQNLFFNRDTAFKNGAWKVHLVMDEIYHEYGKGFIVVGLYSSSFDRTSELSFLPIKDRYKPKNYDEKLGEYYLDFFTKKLIQIIEKKYRVDKTIRYVGGSSMGGIASLLLALKKPYLYQGALCFTPAGMIHYQKDLKPYFDQALSELKAKHHSLPKLYYMVGGVGLETIIKPFCDWSVPYLIEGGYAYGKNISYLYKPKAVHNEKEWAKVLPHSLRWLFDLN